MMPAGARARSLSRPFGLNFVFAPRSACVKGRLKNHQGLTRLATHDSFVRLILANDWREALREARRAFPRRFSILLLCFRSRFVGLR